MNQGRTNRDGFDGYRGQWTITAMGTVADVEGWLARVTGEVDRFCARWGTTAVTETGAGDPAEFLDRDSDAPECRRLRVTAASSDRDVILGLGRVIDRLVPAPVRGNGLRVDVRSWETGYVAGESGSAV